jgi:hypothetical protein
MNRSTIRSLATLVASGALALSPIVASAQAAPATPLTGETVRGAFTNQGYRAEPAVAWWTNDHVTSFRVYPDADRTDPNARVLMVLVYPDMSTAQAARGVAESREQDSPSIITANAGPHLVQYYGPSQWYANVALVESTEGELQRAYAVEQSRDNPMSPSIGPDIESSAAPAEYAVEAQFVSVLIDAAQVNL